LLWTVFRNVHEKDVDEGRGAGRFVHQVSRRIISYSVLQLCFCPVPFSVLLPCCILTPTPYYSPFSKTLKTPIFPFIPSIPLSPFLLFIFSQGCNTVSFHKDRAKGEKTQFREIIFPLPPPLLTCAETLYINFHFIPLFTSLFPPSPLFAISSDQKLAKIRSKVDKENERCFKRKNGFGVIHN